MGAIATMFKKPKTPAEKPVVSMPDENDPAIMAAGANKVNSMRGSGGRSSTLLSMDQERGNEERPYRSGRLGSAA